jgi:hypothetical protein
LLVCIGKLSFLSATIMNATTDTYQLGLQLQRFRQDNPEDIGSII